MAVRILAFAGSLRRDSYNKKLARVAAESARRAGAEVTLLDLRDHPLPIYDGDAEAESGVPEVAMQLKRIFHEHDGLLIASPEYNSGYSGVLKNTIDWVSRPVAGEAPLGAFTGKVAGLISASPGALGGLRGLFALRELLQNIQVMVLPELLAVSKAHEAFTAEGGLKETREQQQLERICTRLVQTLAKLRSTKET